MPRTIRVASTETGALAYLVPVPPKQLPAVPPGDLLHAWTVARRGAVLRQWGTPRFLRFAPGDEREPTEIAIADADASAWAEAVDRAFGLESLTGLSLCLRLLALVEVMARAPRLEPFFDVTPTGVDLHPSLLGAASALPLDQAARFDEGALLEHMHPRALPAGGATSPARHP